MTEKKSESNLPRGKSDSSLGKFSPQLTPEQAVSIALKGIQGALGGKNAVSYFDGKAGREVAETTYSRWIGDPWRFAMPYLDTLVSLNPDFGAWLLKMIPVWMGLDQRVLDSLPPKVAAQVQETYQKLIIEEIGPGKWGRVS